MSNAGRKIDQICQGLHFRNRKLQSMKKAIIFFTCLLFLGTNSILAQDQTFAHLNLGNILAEMPEVKEADEEMKLLRDSLRNVYEQKVSQLEKEYGEFQRKVAEGTVPPVQQQKKAQEFQVKQQEIMQLEQQLSTKMEMRRQQKLAPILDRVDQAIKNVAQENGFTMVFDTSAGSLLFAQDSKDVSNLVKQKLGIQ